NKRYNFKKENT
ncbi:hypothetical protein TNIN_231411, partial [Trichonephila inaurata madagascariensis]